MIAALTAALLPVAEGTTEPRLGNVNPLRVVRLAEEAVRRKAERPVLLSDLCRAAGVSKGWLHRCFEEIYGMSPVQCMRLWRMTAARDALLDRGTGDGPVKQVALRFGFSNSGRFAGEYRSIFG
jgi:transcriptional regulator GlxA family with amidase domain